jgi:predicted CXXCH cytochrome family protein
MRHFPTVFHLLIFAGIMLLAGTIWLAWPERTLAQPPIPHPLEGRDNCLACHETGVAGAPQVPEDHAGRTNEMCPLCHQQAAEPAPFIPHTLEGRENCTECHAPAPAEFTPAVQPTATVQAIPTPLAYPEPVSETNTCLDCHVTLGGRSEQMVSDWQSSIHAARGVICADCHGGDPNALDAMESMSPDAGFIGKPDRTEIPSLCASCHASVTLMRQYDLPTDQYAKYQESFHGQRLAEGDTKVATCFDCHDGHATRETNDPRASVYRLNVPELCAGCHADADYMAEYDIPTNQFELYRTSVHGIALLDNQDIRAPACADCHGTHGAAPPGFEEVSNVCGSCHDATQNYFVSSLHNSDDPNAPRCVTCHGRYDVQQPGEAMFLGDEPRHCGSCHEPDSPEGQIVAKLYQTLSEADHSLEEAEAAVERTSELGMIVIEEENMLAEARTSLITARAAQHTIDLDKVLEESDASITLSEKARQQAEEDVEESRFRRLAMIIAILVIGLIIVSLVMLRRQLD